jgi:uncharacterized protein
MGNTLANTIIYQLQRYRIVLIGVLLVLCCWSGLQLKQITVDNSVEVWFPSSDPSLQEYHRFQEQFGNDEQLVIGVRLSDNKISVEGVQTVETLTAAIENVEGIASVISIVSVPVVTSAEQVFDVQNLRDMGVNEQTILVLQHDKNLQQLLGKDQSITILLAQMDDIENMDSVRDGILLEVRDVVLSVSQQEVHYGGIGIIYAALNQASTVGAVVFIVVSYALIALLLWGLFRRLGPMILTLMSVGVAATILMGVFVFTGNSINMVNMILPTLTLVIGVSGCVHMLMHVSHSSKASALDRVTDGIGFVFWPCLFNVITTCMGFLALGVADMPVIQNLGIYGALGLMLSFVCGVILCSGIGTNKFFLPYIVEQGFVQRTVSKIAFWGQKYSRNMLVLALMVSLLSGIGISRLEVDTYSIAFLKENHQVRQDSEWLEDNYGPYTPIEFTIRTSEEELPTTLRKLSDWQENIKNRTDVGYIRGITQPLQQLQMAFAPESNGVLPENLDSIEQLLFLYSIAPNSDIDELLQRKDGNVNLRFSIGVPMLSAKGFAKKIDSLLESTPFDEEQLQVSGYIPLYVQMMKHIVRSQLSSFALAFVIIFMAIGVLFRSFRMAVLSVPANLLPVMMTLGLMGWLGIRLDVATVTIAAIVLGLVVDDTVQFLYRLKYEQSQTSDVRVAVQKTVLRVGQPMFITTVVLGLGFSVLGLATVTSIAYFGLLLAFALFSALFSDLLVLPAMLILIEESNDSEGLQSQ